MTVEVTLLWKHLLGTSQNGLILSPNPPFYNLKPVSRGKSIN
jgi:hypothetical protein